MKIAQRENIQEREGEERARFVVVSAFLSLLYLIMFDFLLLLF